MEAERDPLVKEIMEAHEREREFIALEIHDNVLQTLASALHHTQIAYHDPENPVVVRQNLLKTLQLLRQSIEAAREVMGELKPTVLDRLGLVETLRYEIEQLKKEMGWQTRFQTEVSSIPKELELPLYRILKEAITNARKHSLSSFLSVRVWVHREPAALVAEVQDQGRGFDLSEVPLDRVGILSMRTRAKTLGGDCQVRSARGEGTTVTVRLPLNVSPVVKGGDHGVNHDPGGRRPRGGAGRHQGYAGHGQ
jgi:two-component system sensor histidine kinase NreB